MPLASPPRLQRPPRAGPGPTGPGGIKMPNPRSPPKQLWSNRTLLFLTTCVGGVTYVLGINIGYEAGKKKAFEDLTGPQRVKPELASIDQSAFPSQSSQAPGGSPEFHAASR